MRKNQDCRRIRIDAAMAENNCQGRSKGTGGGFRISYNAVWWRQRLPFSSGPDRQDELAFRRRCISARKEDKAVPTLPLSANGQRAEGHCYRQMEGRVGERFFWLIRHRLFCLVDEVSERQFPEVGELVGTNVDHEYL